MISATLIVRLMNEFNYQFCNMMVFGKNIGCFDSSDKKSYVLVSLQDEGTHF